MPGKAFGISVVKLNGVDYRTKKGASMELGGVKRTSQYASGVRSGSSEEPEPCKVDVTFEVQTDTDIEAIRKFKGIAEYVTDVGLIYASDNASLSEPPKLSDDGKGLDVKIEGDAAVMSKGKLAGIIP